jgi:hypothetical protein
MARDAEKEKFWRGKMGAYEKSGLTVHEFCEREGLREVQFYYWRRALKEEAKQSGFVELVSAAGANAPAGVSFKIDDRISIFLNRRRDRVKILYWDGGGLALWYKRLERGRFRMPAGRENTAVELSSAELSMLLEGITPLRVDKRYKLGKSLKRTG